MHFTGMTVVILACGNLHAYNGVLFDAVTTRTAWHGSFYTPYRCTF